MAIVTPTPFRNLLRTGSGCGRKSLDDIACMFDRQAAHWGEAAFKGAVGARGTGVFACALDLGFIEQDHLFRDLATGYR